MYSTLLDVVAGASVGIESDAQSVLETNRSHRLIISTDVIIIFSFILW